MTDHYEPVVPHPSPQTLPAATRLGPVHLDVTDADRARTFWTSYIGLTELPGDEASISLGVDGSPLIVLHPGASGSVAPGHTGLFHVAIHVPAQRDLALLCYRLYGLGWEHSPTDHTETAATYTVDPDGNGIEITWETPERGGMTILDGRPVAMLRDGTVRGVTEPLDVDALLGVLDDDPDVFQPLPSGTRIGHVHLTVNSLEDAHRFYVDLIGFGTLRTMTRIRMHDYSLETSYVPHALAFNTWQGSGAQQKPAETAGLRAWHLAVPTEADVHDIANRVTAAGHETASTENGVQVIDPAGNALVIVADEKRS